MYINSQKKYVKSEKLLKKMQTILRNYSKCIPDNLTINIFLLSQNPTPVVKQSQLTTLLLRNGNKAILTFTKLKKKMSLMFFFFFS